MTTGPALDPPTLSFSEFASARAAAPARRPAAAKSASELRFDQRIEAVLRGAVEGLGFSAAEVRLIDEQATEVRTAHHYATDAYAGGDRFLPTPSAPLAVATGELAAMSGSAVVLETADEATEWDITQPCGAAVCVPVASDTTIHGALWLYGDEERDTDNRALQLAEIVAGRIAVEIERQMLLDHERSRATTRPSLPGRRASTSRRRASRRADLQYATRREATPATDTSRVAGMTIAGKLGAGTTHLERRLDDGRVLLAVASVIETPGLAAHETQRIQKTVTTALENLAGPSRDAGALLTDVGRHLWHSTTGGDAVSLAVALVDEESGVATVALAGDAAALRVQASRRTPLSTDLPPIGWDPFDEETDPTPYPCTQLELSVRERLVLAIGGRRQTGAETADQMASGFRSATADEHRQMTARETLARASAAPTAEGSPLLTASVLRLG